MSKIDIVAASGNKHKIQEIKDILKDLPINILSKNDVGLGNLETDEDKDTLEGNALKKAIEISRKIDSVVIADDTGLFVDKLDGRPGVYSSRYAGENSTYEENNKKLLEELKNIPKSERTAKFKTVIAIVLRDGSYKTVSGQCLGSIGLKPKGENGFGYDPLFIVDGYNKTFAELGDEIKNKISHRADALKKLKSQLKVMLDVDEI